MKNKSVFDLDENVVAMLSYLPLFGLFVLVSERTNKFVRFHALQSTLWFILLLFIGFVLSFASSLLGWIWVIGWIFEFVFGLIKSVVFLIGVASIIFLMVRAHGGATSKIPIIGEISWKQVNK
ncbi:MAG: hypothetical protein FWD19_02480 [Defluviitaleaceae bacterium]|nr:hypothetical protein [Defluviitaleaceae bacterium]